METKTVEFDDATYEVTADGDVSEVADGPVEDFFNRLEDNGIPVDRDTMEDHGYIGSSGTSIVDYTSDNLEVYAEESGVTIEHLWVTMSGGESDLPLFIYVKEDDNEPETPFVEYLRDEVFTFGGYAFDEYDDGEVAVSEYEDGGGFICAEDMQRALDDPNVGILRPDAYDRGGHYLEDGSQMLVTDNR